MSIINPVNVAVGSGVMQSSGSIPQPVVQQPVRTDAEIVAQVAQDAHQRLAAGG